MPDFLILPFEATANGLEVFDFAQLGFFVLHLALRQKAVKKIADRMNRLCQFFDGKYRLMSNMDKNRVFGSEFAFLVPRQA